MTDNHPTGGDGTALDRLRLRGVHSIGHRVRTPISVVVSSIQAVAHRDDLPEDARKHLDVAIDQMQRVTDDLELLTDLGAWTDDGPKASRRLGDLVQDVASKRLTATTWSGVEYELAIDDTLEVAVDEPRVRWAIDAVVRDAARRLENGGTVVVATRDGPAGDSVEAIVATVPNSAAADDQGSIELALAAQIVELHGGTVSDVSDGERSGIRARLPAAGAPEGHQPARDTTSPTRSVPASQPDGAGPAQIIGADGDPLVLVIEDDAALVGHLERTLSIDHRVVAVSSADEAAALIGQLRPDVIACDITLPGGRDGEQFVHDLHDDPDLRDLPVLILTGHTDDELRVRMLRDGADDYIVKPFTVEELRVRLDNLIESRLDTEALRARAERTQVLADQLQHALDSRVIIEQAKAFIAAERHIGVDAAFEVLRSYSRSNSLKLHAVAKAVVDEGLRP